MADFRRCLTFRFPPYLARAIEKAAEKEGLSINAYVTRELEKEVERKEVERDERTGK